MSPPHVIVGRVMAPEVRTGFNEVVTTCDMGFNGKYLTWAYKVPVININVAAATILLRNDRFFMTKTI
jgi:hypothetical protein